MNDELKAKKRAAIVRRRQEALMRDFIKLDGGQCGHKDCAAFNAGSRAIAATLDWALMQQVPVEWLNTMIARGLMMVMVVNRLTPEDINGENVGHQPHETN